MENQHVLQHAARKPLVGTDVARKPLVGTDVAQKPLVGIDASRALRVQRTGTERYALEIIRHLLKSPVAKQFRWRLYIDTSLSAAIQPLLDTDVTESETGEERACAVEICHLPSRRLWTHRALRREVEENPPDLLFVPAHVLPFSWLRLHTYIWPRQHVPATNVSGRKNVSSTKYVVTIHDLGYHRFPAAHTWFQRFYLPLSTRWNGVAADHIITPTAFTAADLHERYGTSFSKVTVIHEAPTALPDDSAKVNRSTPADSASEKSQITQLQITQSQITSVITKERDIRPQYALYVGTLQPRKNLRRILIAYAKNIRGHNIPWDLVLAGAPGKQTEALVELASSLGISDRVHFPGYVADEALAALYRSAHIFVFPSLFEGFGLPVLEAQQYGVPVMCANNSSLPEIAGDAALLVDPTDVDAIADAMLRLSEDEALRQQLIERGYANAARFSWEKAARETLAVFEKVLGRGK